MRWQKIGDYVRVQKGMAKKLYASGETVYLCPCNLRPGGPWYPEIGIHFADGAAAEIALDAFEASVDQFTFYNCSNEAGRYPAYYIKRPVRHA